ncbi:MAG: hypothetical protein AB7O56_04165 [Bauldia sp.]
MKELLAALAVVLTFVAYIPYIRSIRRGETKPHVFSWVIWGLSTVLAFLGQLAGSGGIGAWPIGISGLITLYVAFLAWQRRADSTIKPVDWAFFAAALASLPLWWLTNDPLWAIVVLTVVDMLGFVPTFRRAFEHPFGESVPYYVIMAVRNSVAIAALETYSVTTVLFPGTIAVACVIFVTMVAWRRRIVAADASVDTPQAF